jgi:hypothetical protein
MKRIIVRMGLKLPVQVLCSRELAALLYYLASWLLLNMAESEAGLLFAMANAGCSSCLLLGIIFDRGHRKPRHTTDRATSSTDNVHL